jgi:hypothetical protein
MRLPNALTPSSWWRCDHIRDEIVDVNRGRLNLSLLHRVLLARASADYRVVQVSRVRKAATDTSNRGGAT